jgi:ceramide glucosyltransferase
VVSNVILGVLAALSLVLLLWQWAVARRFPLHQRGTAHSFPQAVTLLKPLKGSDPETEACLRSWFMQDYTGRVQILFGVATADDPACAIVSGLIAQFPACDAQLVICGPPAGANAKVSKLVELERLASHDLWVISDADVRVPPDFLTNVVEPLRQPALGLVNCFYRLANPTTLAMHCEALAINADFWSQVLQAQSLKPLDFALGAVMATRRRQLEEIGGFRALIDCLADDYQLGNRIARHGHRITLSPVVVDCWETPMNWAAVWKHQLRWARTIRVCQPAPYFFSLLSNATLWPLLWLVVHPGPLTLIFMLSSLLVRVASALDLQWRLTRSLAHARHVWLAPAKDLFQALIWLWSFAGNRIEWRGERMKLRPDGTLMKD